MSEMTMAVLYASLAGAAIPLGGMTARLEHIQPEWLETEFRHSVIAFGGGALLAAVALVLVPEGMRHLPTWKALAAFGSGGGAFFMLDRLIERGGGSVAQLMAMLLDFVPEAMAMGATLATEPAVGLLLAILIALQNYPEGFNAYRELRLTTKMRATTVLVAFCALVPLGPAAAWLGLVYLRSAPDVLGAVMLFAAGGILYFTFEDLAPQAYLEQHWAPPLGAVSGFMVGMLGHALVS
nr:divalent cation transporter [Nitrococcus mobilis]